MGRFVRVVRRVLLAVWMALLALAVGLSVTSHVAPAIGRELLIVRGASMEPAIPLGSVVAIAPVASERIGVGDVITVRADNGVVYTHRVIRTTEAAGERYFETKGDASRSPDPGLVPARAVLGKVELHAPLAGFGLALLGMPAGVAAVVALLGAMLFLIWLIEDLAPAPPRRHASGPITTVGASA